MQFQDVFICSYRRTYVTNHIIRVNYAQVFDWLHLFSPVGSQQRLNTQEFLLMIFLDTMTDSALRV